MPLALLLLSWSLPSLAAPDAAALFHDYCSVCHGDQGDGKSRAQQSMNPPPRDFTTAGASVDLSRERMIRSVSVGIPGTAMSAWHNQLSPEQIEAVVDYIRDRFMMPATTDDAGSGRRLFAEYCSVCHGDKGNGQSRASRSLAPPPRDFTTAEAASELTRDRMLFAVKYGVPNTAMPGWGTQLDDVQVAAVVDYVRNAFMTPEMKPEVTHAGHGDGHMHDAVADRTAPFPDGLVGDIESGEGFYRQNCAVCHGDTGDGRGPRAYFINPKPRDFSHPAARANLNRPHLYAAIADGKLRTEMPAWKHVLDAQEMANVAEYVFQAFIMAEAPVARDVEPDARGHADHGPAGHAH